MVMLTFQTPNSVHFEGDSETGVTRRGISSFYKVKIRPGLGLWQSLVVEWQLVKMPLIYSFFLLIQKWYFP